MDGLKITLGSGAAGRRHKGHVSSECDGLSFVVISQLKTNVFYKIIMQETSREAAT